MSIGAALARMFMGGAGGAADSLLEERKAKQENLLKQILLQKAMETSQTPSQRDLTIAQTGYYNRMPEGSGGGGGGRYGQSPGGDIYRALSKEDVAFAQAGQYNKMSPGGRAALVQSFVLQQRANTTLKDLFNPAGAGDTSDDF